MLQQDTIKVLIVDDSEIIVSRIRNLLSELENINVVGDAINYNDAMNIIRQKTPDVVLLDIDLPGKSGIDILKEIKQNHPVIKVIMLTNNSGPYYRTICEKAGTDYFFDKSSEFQKVPEVLISLARAETK